MSFFSNPYLMQGEIDLANKRAGKPSDGQDKILNSFLALFKSSTDKKIYVSKKSNSCLDKITEERKNEVRDSVLELIKENDLSRASDILDSFCKDLDIELADDLVLFQSKLSQINRDYRNDLIKYEEYLHQKSKLNAALIDLCRIVTG